MNLITEFMDAPAVSAPVDALRGERVGGAGLDVFETEPTDELSTMRFQAVPILILTPHIAGMTVESNARVSALIAETVGVHLKGLT